MDTCYNIWHMLKLIIPSLEHKDSYLEVMSKKDQGKVDPSKDYYSVANLTDQIKRWENLSKDKENGRIQYWMIMDDSVYVGSFQIRYKASGSSPELASNLGWAIDHPDYDTDQNKKLILELGLEKVKESGLKEVIVTCEEKDVFTKELIEKNGATFIEKLPDSVGENVLRYSLKF